MADLYQSQVNPTQSTSRWNMEHPVWITIMWIVLISSLILTRELLVSGEALEEDDDYDDEDEEGEEEEDEDEDADPDFDPSKVKPGQNPQECKQQ